MLGDMVAIHIGNLCLGAIRNSDRTYLRYTCLRIFKLSKIRVHMSVAHVYMIPSSLVVKDARLIKYLLDWQLSL